MKFFFQIDEKEQKKRLDKLADDKNTSWRVSEHDVWQNKHYDKCMDVYEQYLCDTNQSSAPWYLVDAKDKKWAQLQILETLVQGIDTALQNSTLAVPLLQNAFPLKPIEKLADVALDKTLTEEEYDTLLNQYQKRLRELHNELYRKKIPVIIAYEGWDAAGKGGNIKRITEALDPRGYEVHPIASPEPHEKGKTLSVAFLERDCQKPDMLRYLTERGTVVSWLNGWRAFAVTNDWQRAYSGN